MDQDPEFRARMEALLRSRVFRSKMAEVESTKAALRSAVEEARRYDARLKDATTAKQAATETAAAAMGENDDGGGGGGGDDQETDEVAAASKK